MLATAPLPRNFAVAYIETMARGWESKSIVAQIEATNSSPSTHKERSAPTAGQIQDQIRKANLQLSRSRILQQLQASSNERYSELLRRSLADLDGQLAAE